MLFYGPIIFGFIIGFLLGTRIKSSSKDNYNFPNLSFLTIFIVVIIIAWQLGPFPYYKDLPLASGFLFAYIGLLLAKLVFRRNKKSKINN